MRIENSFVVPASIDNAWTALLDVEKLAPCMPGASLESFDGEQIVGKVRVKLGPITVAYGGTAHFVRKDSQARHVVIRANGKERNGNGTADAEVSAQLVAEGDSTRVNVVTNLDITGRPAQFGRGVLTSVARQLVDKFAANLAATMTTAPTATAANLAPGAAAEALAATPTAAVAAPPEAAPPPPLDVAELLGLQRVAWRKYLPYAAIAVLSVLLIRSRRRRREA